MTEKTEADKEMTKNANTDTNEITMRNKKAAAKLNTKTKKRNKQTVTVIVIKAAIMTAAETNIKTKKMMNFKFKKNIRLLTAI